MKTKILFSLAIAFASLTFKAQCSSTQIAGLVVSTTTLIPFSDPFTIKICSTGIAYDTTGNNGRVYFLENGAKLTLKLNSTTAVYMKTGSTLKMIGNGSTIVYTEPTTTITGLSGPAVTSCSLVTFPASPSCATTKINKNNENLNPITFYPNPSKNNLIFTNESAIALNIQITNALGQNVKTFVIETGRKVLDVSDLNDGVYYVSISENSKIILTKKLIITK